MLNILNGNCWVTVESIYFNISKELCQFILRTIIIARDRWKEAGVLVRPKGITRDLISLFIKISIYVILAGC